MYKKQYFYQNREAGMSSLLVSMLVAGTSLVIIGGVREYLQRQNEAENQSIRTYQLELANEAAASLMSQLYGSSTIQRSGSNFIVNSIISNKNNETWKIKNGDVEIYTCFQQSDQTKQQVFTSQDTSVVPPCNPETRALTTINFIKKIDAEKITGANKEDPYILAEGTTVFKGASITRKFRLRGAEATKVCNSLDDKNSLASCNVDHCKFMAPLRDAANNIVYQPGSGGGAVELEVNTLFSEPVILRQDPAQTAIRKIAASDPEPLSIIGFFNNAYERGRIDPFHHWQSIDPIYRDEDYVKRNPDGTIELKVPNTVTGDVGRGVPKFEGFLRYDPRTNLSHPEPWPDGEPYSKNRENFKQACNRTIGTTGPDLCARINLAVKGTVYSYSQRRRCWYQGPKNYPEWAKNYTPVNSTSDTQRTTLAAGSFTKISLVVSTGRAEAKGDVPQQTGQQLRDWEEIASKSYEEFSPFESAAADEEEGEHLVDDKRSLWIDSKPHHELGPMPELKLHVPTPHVFKDIMVGSLKTREVKKVLVGATTKMIARDKIYRWDTTCDYKKPEARADIFGKQFEICFYITYNNIMDRFNCTRKASDWVCRNLDGCFVDDTPILMADGSVKAIQDVREGDFVYNPVLKKGVQVATMVVGQEKGDLYKISYVYGAKVDSVTSTHNHPFVTRTGIRVASDLKVGQTIVDKDLKDKEIINIEKIKSAVPKMVWNILLRSDEGTLDSQYAHHSFVAGGLMSGDYYVQQTASFAKGEYEKLSQFLNARAAAGSLKSQ